MEQVRITLNPNGVMAPAIGAIQNTLQVASYCLAAIDEGDLETTIPFNGDGLQFSFDRDPRDLPERRQAYRNWVLRNAFSELARGVRKSLEEAYLYVGVAELAGVSHFGDLEAYISKLKEDANKANFPTLILRINESLDQKLHFEDEFKSLIKVRNCLEHRNGVVGQADIERETGSLVLSLPHFRWYYYKDGLEVELRRGTYIEKGERIVLKREIANISYAEGDRITFSIDELQLVGMACWLFVQDLTSKLPRPSAAVAA